MTKKLRFVVSLITHDNDYQRAQADSAEETARRLNIDLEILYAENDAVTQSQQLIRAIQNSSVGVDALITEPAGGTAFPQAARAAVAAGIGWIVLNRHDSYIPELRRSSSVPIGSVSSDNQEIGRIQARQIAALLPTGGTVLYIQGPSVSSVSAQRLAGTTSAKPPNLSLKLLRCSNWTDHAGFQAVSAWLQLSTSRNSDLQGVLAQNDAIALGAHRAFREISSRPDREQWLHMPFLGIDGLRAGRMAVQRGTLAATITSPPISGQAIELMARALRERTTLPESTLVAAQSVPEISALVSRVQAGKTS